MIDTQKLRDLLAAATPGPWTKSPQPSSPICVESEGHKWTVYEHGEPTGTCNSFVCNVGDCEANAALIAAAVNALPELLDEVERLRASKPEFPTATTTIPVKARIAE